MWELVFYFLVFVAPYIWLMILQTQIDNMKQKLKESEVEL